MLAKYLRMYKPPQMVQDWVALIQVAHRKEPQKEIFLISQEIFQQVLEELHLLLV